LLPQTVAMFEASAAYTSGTGGALEVGTLHAAAVPEAKELVRFPSWPLQSRLVLDLIEQPARFMTGAPFNDKDTWEEVGRGRASECRNCRRRLRSRPPGP
jgi:hypothetical protein